jgi:hypothetical protein
MPFLNDLVEITHFDDGNQQYISLPNIWKITGFKFNKSKSIIINLQRPEIKRSISSWKIRVINYSE